MPYFPIEESVTEKNAAPVRCNGQAKKKLLSLCRSKLRPATISNQGYSICA